MTIKSTKMAAAIINWTTSQRVVTHWSLPRPCQLSRRRKSLIYWWAV
jgi:hypothetical protein